MTRTSRKKRAFRPSLSDTLENRVVPSTIGLIRNRQAVVSRLQAEHQALIRHRQALHQQRQALFAARTNTNRAALGNLVSSTAAVRPSALGSNPQGLTSYGYGYAARLRRAYAGSTSTTTSTAAANNSRGIPPTSPLARVIHNGLPSYGYGYAAHLAYAYAGYPTSTGVAGASSSNGPPYIGTTGGAGTPSTAIASANSTSNQAGTVSLSGRSDLAASTGLFGLSNLVGSAGQGGPASPSVLLSPNNSRGQGTGLNNNRSSASAKISHVTGQVMAAEPSTAVSSVSNGIYGTSGLGTMTPPSAFVSNMGGGVGYAMGTGSSLGAGGAGVAGISTPLLGASSAPVSSVVAGTAGLGNLPTSNGSSAEFGTMTGTGSPTGPFQSSSGALSY